MGKNRRDDLGEVYADRSKSNVIKVPNVRTRHYFVGWMELLEILRIGVYRYFGGKCSSKMTTETENERHLFQMKETTRSRETRKHLSRIQEPIHTSKGHQRTRYTVPRVEGMVPRIRRDLNRVNRS